MNFSRSIYRATFATVRWLADYHAYEVLGLESVPRRGPALIVGNHSLATYDGFMLGAHILEHVGRLPHMLADRVAFRTPILGQVFTEVGMVNGTRENALSLLREGEMIGLAPGGMREQLRSSREKYQVNWRDRLGFVWMSMLTGAPVILAACPRSDDIFDVLPNPITPWVYDRFHLPLPFFRGRNGLPVPRPVKLWHLLSEPIVSSVPPDKVQREDVERHHKYLVERMERLMADSLELKG